MAKELYALEAAKHQILHEKDLTEAQANDAFDVDHDAKLAAHLYFAADAYERCIKIIDKILHESH